MPRIRTADDVRAVMELKAEGYTDREVSRCTGVPVNTIRLWRNRGLSRYAKRALKDSRLCNVCGCDSHDFASLPAETYAYLLALYLGDGCLVGSGSSWSLRIVLDQAYPLTRSCCDAVETIRGCRRPRPTPDSRGTACLRTESTGRPWVCLFPQHGLGRKHGRRIALTDWQERIVDAAPEPFLRGLVQTDGWRGVNRVHAKGKDYVYPRYQFSNRSDDIRKLFADTCDGLGVEWRPWTRHNVSVAKRESVALLDLFIGPKA